MTARSAMIAVGDPHLRAVEHPAVGGAARMVRISAGSEPPCDSVRPKQPMTSPRAMRGSHFCFCASLPKAKIACMHRLDCTDTKLRSALSPRSSLAAHQTVAHGIQAGAAVALQYSSRADPAARIEGTSSLGKRLCSKHSPMMGSTRSSTKRATESRTSAHPRSARYRAADSPEHFRWARQRLLGRRWFRFGTHALAPVLDRIRP
jgi:hypothetical protein